MKTYRKYAHGMMALTLLMSISPQSLAVVRVGGAVPMVAVQQQPGDYNHTVRQIDESKINIEIIRVLEQRSKEDAEYVKDSVNQIRVAVNAIIDDQLKGGLKKLSDDSIFAGQAADVRTFLASKRALEASIENLNSLINGLTKLPSVMKGNASISVVNRVQEIQNRFNIDMSALVASFEGQVQDIVDSLSTLSFRVVAKNGKIVNQHGLTLSSELSKNQYTAQEINDMRKQARDLKVKDLTKIENEIDTLNSFTLAEIRSGISSYGIAYRANMDETGLTMALEKIEKTFFARSLLRAQYGIPLGALHMNYELKSLNWDFFSSSNKLQFTGNVIRRSSELTSLHNAIATALVTQEGRKDEVFGANKSIFGRVTSAITWVKGERALARLNYLMLKLIVADIEEEMTVGQPGGRRLLKNMIRSRYYTSVENETHYKDIIRELSGQGKDAWSDAGNMDANSLVGTIELVRTTLASYKANLDQAQVILDSVAQIEKDINGGNIDTINDDLLK